MIRTLVFLTFFIFGAHISKAASIGDAVRAITRPSDLSLVWYKRDGRQMVQILKSIESTEKGMAHFYLSQLYSKGLFVEKDIEKSKFYLNSSIKLGYYVPLLNISRNYNYGFDVQIDHRKAALWYSRAAENYEHVTAPIVLRAMEKGNRPITDLVRNYFKKNAIFKLTNGQKLSSDKQENRITLPQYFELFDNAVRDGNAESSFKLADIAEEQGGYGMQVKWLLLATKLGHAEAPALLGEIYGQQAFYSKRDRRYQLLELGIEYSDLAVKRGFVAGAVERDRLTHNLKILRERDANYKKRLAANAAITLGIIAFLFASSGDTNADVSGYEKDKAFRKSQENSTWGHIGAALILP